MLDNLPQTSSMRNLEINQSALTKEASHLLVLASYDAGKVTEPGARTSAAAAGAIVGAAEAAVSTSKTSSAAEQISRIGTTTAEAGSTVATESQARPKSAEKPGAVKECKAETLAGAAKAGVEGGAAAAKSNQHKPSDSRREHHEPTGLELPNPYPSGNDKDVQNSDLPPKMVGPDPRTMQKIGEELKKLLFGPADKNKNDATHAPTGLQNPDFNKAIREMKEAILQGVKAANLEAESATKK